MAALHSATVREMKAFNCCKDKPDDSEKTVRKKKQLTESSAAVPPEKEKQRAQKNDAGRTHGFAGIRKNHRRKNNHQGTEQRGDEQEDKTLREEKHRKGRSRRKRKSGNENQPGGNHNRKRHVLRSVAKRAVKGLMAATVPPPLFILAFLKGCCLGRSDNVLARTGIIGRTDFHGHF